MEHRTRADVDVLLPHSVVADVLHDAQAHIWLRPSEATVVFQIATSLIKVAGFDRRRLAISEAYRGRQRPDIVLKGESPSNSPRAIFEVKANRIYADEDAGRIDNRPHAEHVFKMAVDLLRLAQFDAPGAKRFFIYRDEGQIVRRFRGDREPDKFGFLRDLLPLFSRENLEDFTITSDAFTELMDQRLPHLTKKLRPDENKARRPASVTITLARIATIWGQFDEVMTAFELRPTST